MKFHIPLLIIVLCLMSSMNLLAAESINITYPENNYTNFNSNSVTINYTIDLSTYSSDPVNYNLKCSYTLNGVSYDLSNCNSGSLPNLLVSINNTFVLYSKVFNTTVPSSIIYSNNFSVLFKTDIVAPVVTISSPINSNIYNYSTISINYTFSDSNPFMCWYSINDVIKPNITCGTNVLNLTLPEGTNSLKFWMNDTAGNIDYESKTFYVDTVFPVHKGFDLKNITYNYIKYKYGAYEDINITMTYWTTDRNINKSVTTSGYSDEDYITINSLNNNTIYRFTLDICDIANHCKPWEVGGMWEFTTLSPPIGSSCTTNYQCTEWSLCDVTEIQRRTCTKMNDSCIGTAPTTQQACYFPAQETILYSALNINQSTNDTNSTLTSNDNSTGMSTSLKVILWGAAIFGVVVVGLLIKRYYNNKGGDPTDYYNETPSSDSGNDDLYN